MSDEKPISWHGVTVDFGTPPSSMSSKWNRSSLNATLKGLPEMEYFESDVKREEALRTLEVLDHRITVRRLAMISLKAVLLGVPIYFLFDYLFRWLQWPRNAIQFFAQMGVFSLGFLIDHWYQRRTMPQMLRQELLNQGVPVCMSCGYLLRGLPIETGRCPECGYVFDAKVLEILEYPLSDEK